MKIITYRELEPKEDFMMLMDIAFWWPISPKTMEERISYRHKAEKQPSWFLCGGG